MVDRFKTLKLPYLKSRDEIRRFLDPLADRFNRPDFIERDPISIPHRFAKKQDVEIAGLLAALFAWGQRTTILRKAASFLEGMDNSPHDFILHHSSTELKRWEDFRHRTFNGTDALYLIHFLRKVYTESDSLETAFFPEPDASMTAVESGLIRFRSLFTSDPWFPSRSGKHVSSPESGSACKRLNMFLRWMVRSDKSGVDFGIWRRISPAQLVCPCDLHVERNARILGLVTRPNPDWKMALELTENLRELDPKDPVKYDFALFGMGISGEFQWAKPV